MTERELELIRNARKLPVGPFCIWWNEFTENYTDRTLLWGFDCDRNSFHVYLRGGMVWRVVYEHGAPSITGTSTFPTLADLVPNKRLYPEACDFEFCMMLRERGVEMIFTDIRHDRPAALFYGRLADDHTT